LPSTKVIIVVMVIMMIYDINDIIQKLEHTRTMIAYDNIYPALTLLFYNILPQFANRRIFFAIYSDITCRGLRRFYTSSVEKSPELATLFEKANVIKIGQKKQAAFGTLYKFIPESEADEELQKLKDPIDELTDKDVLVFIGFHKLVLINGPGVLKNAIKIFNSLPDEMTVFCFTPLGMYDEKISSFIEGLYDVMIKIKREEELMTFGEEIYLLGVEHSLIQDIQTGYGRFKITENCKFVRV